MNNIIGIPPKQSWYNRLWYWITYPFYYRRRRQAFSAMVSPIIKNMCEISLAKDLISVQPMDLPSANVFYMDYISNTPLPWYKRWMWWKNKKSTDGPIRKY